MAVTLLATGGLVAGSLPAQATESVTRTAQRVTEQQVGAPAEVLATTTSFKGLTIRPATADGTPVQTLTARKDDGISVVAVLDEGQDTVTFPSMLPAGHRLLADGKGGFLMTDGGLQVTGTVSAPWARDATGRSLPTTYALDGQGALTQHVDTTDAAFPVVADPHLVVKWYGVYLAGWGYDWKLMRAALIAIAGSPIIGGCALSSRIPSTWRPALALLCGSIGAGSLKSLLKWVESALRKKDIVGNKCYRLAAWPAGFGTVTADGWCRD